MDDVTFRQLRYVDALARHTHFGHAASACAITQPALSVQIKELEQTLGQRLFERGRQIRLTGFGETFVDRARDILRSMEELGELARAAQDGFAGRLRLGVIPTVAPYLLPRLIPALTQTYPELDLYLRETMTSQLLAELTDGTLDCAVVALPVSEPSLTEMPLFDENFVLVRPASERGTPVPAPDALRKMRLLLLEEGHCFRDQALAFCSMDAKQPRELLDGSSLSTLVQMVSAGIGVTLVPEMALPVETRSANIDIVSFPAPQPNRTIGMIWRATTPIAEQLKDIGALVRTQARR